MAFDKVQVCLAVATLRIHECVISFSKSLWSCNDYLHVPFSLQLSLLDWWSQPYLCCHYYSSIALKNESQPLALLP